MKSKLPIGTKLHYHAYGQGPGRPCEIIGIAQSGRYAVRREDCGKLQSSGQRGSRVTHVSDKTLASKEYVIVEQPPELWGMSTPEFGDVLFTSRAAVMKRFEQIELERHDIERIELRSNHGEHETWDRYEGTGKFVKAPT